MRRKLQGNVNRHIYIDIDICLETGGDIPLLKCDWIFKDLKGQGLLSHLKDDMSSLKPCF